MVSNKKESVIEMRVYLMNKDVNLYTKYNIETKLEVINTGNLITVPLTTPPIVNMISLLFN